MATHSFGGGWTEIKLAILRSYLGFYTKALKNKSFQLVYIDAFAGTGERQQTKTAAPLLGEDEEIEILAGSARIALSTDPAFSSYHFIEKKPRHFQRLQQVIAETQYQHLRNNIHCHPGDANEELKRIINSYYQDNTRAVLFLDPYGLSVDWSTLEHINATHRTDIWFLFSLSGFARNASIEFEKIEDYKKKKIDCILGTDEWQQIFYSTHHQTGQVDMFGTITDKSTRTATINELEKYVHQRLSGLFAYVEQPVPLPPRGSQLYSLFLCVSNPSDKATTLARKVAREIILKNQ